MTHFLYQAAADAARHARTVFNRFYKKELPSNGENFEPKANIEVEIGYVRITKIGDVEKKEFITCNHLNKRIAAHLEKNLQAIVEEAVLELEEKAKNLTKGSRQAVAEELARIDKIIEDEGPEAA